MRLLTKNFKSEKTSKDKVEIRIQQMLPHSLAGGVNLCPHSSVGCRSDCLVFAGRGKMNTVQKARYSRTLLYLNNRDEHKRMLMYELELFDKYCKKRDLFAAVRLNGFTDIRWDKIYPEIFEIFTDIQFYDYTKNPVFMEAFLKGGLPNNYHLTFSRSEDNEDICFDILRNNGHVAVVFFDRPKTWNRFKVYSGDDRDDRFNDTLFYKGKVCGLTAKGKALHDTTGFVVA